MNDWEKQSDDGYYNKPFTYSRYQWCKEFIRQQKELSRRGGVESIKLKHAPTYWDGWSVLLDV